MHLISGSQLDDPHVARHIAGEASGGEHPIGGGEAAALRIVHVVKDMCASVACPPFLRWASLTSCIKALDPRHLVVTTE